MVAKFGRLTNFRIWRILIWWNFGLTTCSLAWPDLILALLAVMSSNKMVWPHEPKPCAAMPADGAILG